MDASMPHDGRVDASPEEAAAGMCSMDQGGGGVYHSGRETIGGAGMARDEILREHRVIFSNRNRTAMDLKDKWRNMLDSRVWPAPPHSSSSRTVMDEEEGEEEHPRAHRFRQRSGCATPPCIRPPLRRTVTSPAVLRDRTNAPLTDRGGRAGASNDMVIVDTTTTSTTTTTTNPTTTTSQNASDLDTVIANLGGHHMIHRTAAKKLSDLNITCNCSVATQVAANANKKGHQSHGAHCPYLAGLRRLTNG
mmetsp:Transcript_23963/g.59379  ORF Transcript_23963/g.59379 Transcript_23963/m.59379 type:complete len:249 (+) Transcript_23963:522-1268(+)